MNQTKRRYASSHVQGKLIGTELQESGEGSDQESQVEEDYDVDEEFDNDYAENYFDNGEDDNLDDMVGGDDGGGGMLLHYTNPRDLKYYMTQTLTNGIRLKARSTAMSMLIHSTASAKIKSCTLLLA
jgi:hypothetical protein